MPTEPTARAPKVEISQHRTWPIPSVHRWRWHVWIRRDEVYSPDSRGRVVALDGYASSLRDMREQCTDAKRRVLAAWAALGGEEPRG